MLTRIRTLGDPVLTNPVERIKNVDEISQGLINQMFDAMYENNGVGLAANQIGITKSVFVYDDRNGNKGFMINPWIIPETRESIKMPEGCLSVPGTSHETPRCKQISIKAITSLGGTISELENVDGLLAQIFQHETDHLKGKLYISLLPKETQMAIVLANQII